MSITFKELADHLMHGREIEFVYKNRAYSITNHSGSWYLCDDTDHICLSTLCRFAEKEILVSKVAAFVLDGRSIAEIFNGQLYDADRLAIM